MESFYFGNVEDIKYVIPLKKLKDKKELLLLLVLILVFGQTQIAHYWWMLFFDMFVFNLSFLENGSICFVGGNLKESTTVNSSQVKAYELIAAI